MTQKESWYNSWFVSDDYLETALKRLDEDGTDMTKVFIVTANRSTSDYSIIWKKIDDI